MVHGHNCLGCKIPEGLTFVWFAQPCIPNPVGQCLMANQKLERGIDGTWHSHSNRLWHRGVAGRAVLYANYCVMVWILREGVLKISLVLISTRKAVMDLGQKPKWGKQRYTGKENHLCHFLLELGAGHRTQKKDMQLYP